MSDLGGDVRAAVDTMVSSMFKVTANIKPKEEKAADVLSNVLSTIEANEALSVDELVDVCYLVSEDPKFGSLYLALSSSVSRTRYLERRLGEFHARKGNNGQE
jgi:hypothetical protein